MKRERSRWGKRKNGIIEREPKRYFSERNRWLPRLRLKKSKGEKRWKPGRKRGLSNKSSSISRLKT